VLEVRIAIGDRSARLVTIPGGVWGTRPWEEIARDARAMIVVAGGLRAHEGANRRAFAHLPALLQLVPRPSRAGIAILTRQDLVEHPRVDSVELASALAEASGRSPWEVIPLRPDAPPVDHLLRAIAELLGYDESA
jgi:hypothetical protein